MVKVRWWKVRVWIDGEDGEGEVVEGEGMDRW